MKNSSEITRIMETKKLMTATTATITTAGGEVVEIRHILEGIFDAIWACNLRDNDKMDIYQDASMKLLKYFGNNFFPERFKPYAYGRRVGWNMAANFHNRDKREIPFSCFEIIDEDGNVFSPFDNLCGDSSDDFCQDGRAAREKNDRRLWKAVESLKDNYRDVIIMRYRDEMKYEEIAEELGTTAEVVYKWGNRAREALERMLGESFVLEYLGNE